jgi:predicted nuclease of restriction endonuclease-like (RecB) superfamily
MNFEQKGICRNHSMQKFILKINQIYIFTALPKNIEIYEPIWNITLVKHIKKHKRKFD